MRIHAIIRQPVWIVAAIVAIVAALVPGLRKLETDNSPAVFFRDGAAQETYREFKRTFGSDNLLRFVIRGEGIFSRMTGYEAIKRLESSAVVYAPGVASTYGFGSRYRTLSRLTIEEPNANYRQRVLDSELNLQLGLVDRAGTMATVGLLLGELSPKETRHTLYQLRDVARRATTETYTVELVGQPVLNEALDRASVEVGKKFLPLLIGIAVALLWWVFRDVGSMLLPLSFVAVTLVALFGAMGFAGVRLNLVLSILSPLLFVVSTATAIHLVSAYRRRAAASLDDTLNPAAQALTDKSWAIFWAGLTTFAGFAALGTSDLRPVASLGLWSGIGILWLTVLAFTYLPAMLAWNHRQRDGQSGGPAGAIDDRVDRRLSHRGRLWAHAAIRLRRPILGTAVLVAALGGWGITRLEPETNGLRFLAPDHPVRQAIEQLEADGIETAGFELWLRFPASDNPEEFTLEHLLLERPELLERLAPLERALASESGSLAVLSAATITREVLRTASRYFPQVGAETLLSTMQRDSGASEAFAAFAAGRSLRLHVGTRTDSATALEPLYRRAETLARDAFPEAEVVVTGLYPLLLESQRGLFETLGRSLGLTFLVIAAVFRYLLGSTRLTLLVLVPNTWPILVVLGGMGWLGVPLDIGTVMVASIVLGLVVDDTIHTLNHFLKAAPTVGVHEAVLHALEHTAPAYVLTGLILTLGFGVCGFSSFLPIARFGLCSAVAVGLAVLCDLILVPALLSMVPDQVIAKRAG